MNVDASNDQEFDSRISDSDRKRRDELLRYLERTAEIDGPQRDLIFSESAGSTFGLPAELADLLEADAVDGRWGPVRERLLPMAPGEREAAFRLLVSAHREFLGVEATNVLVVALSIVRENLVPPNTAASQLVRAVANALLQGELPLGSLIGALLVAMNSKGGASRKVTRAILLDARLLQSENEELAAQIVEFGGRDASELSAPVGRLVVGRPDSVR